MGSKAPATTTQVNKTELSPEQTALMQLALPFAQSYAQQPLQTYGGSTVAGFTPLEQQGQAGVVGAAGGAMTDLANAGTTAQLGLLDPTLMDPANNPYVNNQATAITGKVTDNLLQNILPQIRSSSSMTSGPYAGGGTRSGVAEGLAVGRTNEELSRALAGLYGNAYQTGLSTMGQAVQRNPVAMASSTMPSVAMGDVGAQQRAMEQANLDAAYQQWALAQQLPYIRASEIMGLVGGMPGASGVSTVTGAQPQTNPIMGGLGGATTGLALASMIPGLNAFATPLALGAGAAGYFGSK